MRVRIFIPLILTLAFVAQSQPARTPGAGLNFYSLDRETALGEQLAEAVRRESTVLDSDLVQGYVANLGRQLALQAHGPNFPYTFTVIADFPGGIADNPTHEAMALPGGAIFVPASLILEAQSTAELAGMLAHGIAHVADHDCTRSRTRADLMQIGAIAASRFPDCFGLEDGAVSVGYLAFQRAFESQADYFAVQIMAQAGYDPAALVAYIRRTQQAPMRQATVSRVSSPWPVVDERIKQIEKEIRTLPAGPRYESGEDIGPIQSAVRNPPVKR